LASIRQGLSGSESLSLSVCVAVSRPLAAVNVCLWSGDFIPSPCLQTPCFTFSVSIVRAECFLENLELKFSLRDTRAVSGKVTFKSNAGNTLLEGMCIRLIWHLHNHNTTRVYDNIKCYSLSNVIFNAKMTLFDLTLAHNKDISNNVIFALKMSLLSE